MVVTGLVISPVARRKAIASIATIALITAISFETGIGKLRVQGYPNFLQDKIVKVLEAYDGPEATVAAIEYSSGGRAVVIDGFLAAVHGGSEKWTPVRDYMVWMGRLPMLLHHDPQDVLVICFGTGQTANAVREEEPQTLDIVDINPRIFKLAHHFDQNKGVLQYPRVTPIVMDGRAYMRRTDKTYDVITMEPMPPTFAGVNSLYSKEFYQLAHQRLKPGGIIVQWLPIYLVTVHESSSIAKTFYEVFPNAVLWLVPGSPMGILLGKRDDDERFGLDWPGLDNRDRKKYAPYLQDAIFLRAQGIKGYGQHGDTITDDNQLLSYEGIKSFSPESVQKMFSSNQFLLEKAQLEAKKK